MTSSPKLRPTLPTTFFAYIYVYIPSHSLPQTHKPSPSCLGLCRYLKEEKTMSDWGPVFVAMVLFVLLTPGLLFQVPGHHRCVEFGNFKTSGASVLIHSLLYFGLICVFLLAVKVHLYLG
ncbi:hypothetical protein ES319_D12G170700v1 [Gossypium barbadense]|uniref:Transmembrane protein n=9 Tax=Gossypium TaxID=3633 RepID=A0A5J5NZ76_GOSBA|nr:hypothetical protein ES319_D12G170700v1 [Gossypium barbadense]TYG41495.1 hypothetical protein ES288_D12G179600v1 [Gossypium darwinii]TYH39465.1 hypothetical protein ES332_D12G180700v1 [Gossypium tomentosum]